MDTLIQGSGVTKRYGDFTLDAFNITVAPDRIVGLIGSNGAGKTTLLKTLLGMTTPDAGTIRLFGIDPHASSALDAIKQRIGVVLDTCAFPVTMKVRDVEMLGRAAYEKWDGAQFTSLCETFGLEPKRQVKDLSRGMGMKLSLAFALAHDPDLLILDEATAGLDPIARDEVLDLIRAFMERDGHGVLMATHITTDLEKIADEVICINNGALVFALAKETICDEAGIAHCRAAELERVKEGLATSPAASNLGNTSAAAAASANAKVSAAWGGVLATASAANAEGAPSPAPLRYLPRGLSVDLLVPDRFAFSAAFPNIPVDRASIEDYLTLTLKGEAL